MARVPADDVAFIDMRSTQLLAHIATMNDAARKQDWRLARGEAAMVQAIGAELRRITDDRILVSENSTGRLK